MSSYICKYESNSRVVYFMICLQTINNTKPNCLDDITKEECNQMT